MSNGKAKGTIGKPFYTYIEECIMEKRIGLPLENENNSKSCVWGHLGERYVMSKPEFLGIEYSQRPDEPLRHPKIDFWVGTPDFTKENTVADLKCPWTRKSFCQLVQPLYDGLTGLDAMNKIRDTHKDGDTYYYQLVSNAILTNAQFAELCVFMPYKHELDDLRQLAQQAEGSDLKRFYGLAMSDDEELPYLIEGVYYKNFNRLRFEVPQSDKELLTQRVIEAGKLLNEVNFSLTQGEKV